ncbi:ABC transporter permease [Mesorhizobium sp. A623]
MSSDIPSGLGKIFWWTASMCLFFGAWELAYIYGLYNRELLPAPHIFLPQFPVEAANFDASGFVPGQEQQPNPIRAVLETTFATLLRVFVGLGVGFTGGVLTGVLIRYYNYFGKLTLPVITLLAPISPFAWLPVMVFIVGVGNASAISLVFVAVYFIIAISTITEVDNVKETYLDVARTLGASHGDTYRLVIIPAILPGLFLILRLNLFGAWMMVLVAESAGVGTGLGAVVMMARNTGAQNLALLGLVVVGVAGGLSDFVLRIIQNRLLFWVEQKSA